MKEKIHPKYTETTIMCVCGETIQTRSTKENIHIEICSKCHPFFTGKQKLVDSAGRVDKFRKRFEKKKNDKSKTETNTASKEKTNTEKLDELEKKSDA